MQTTTTSKLARVVPISVRNLEDPQTAIPRIAEDSKLTAEIEEAVRSVPTKHDLHCCDARRMEFLEPNSLHLTVTSPPYWTLKKYNVVEGQLGYLGDYEEFLNALDEVWRHV